MFSQASAIHTTCARLGCRWSGGVRIRGDHLGLQGVHQLGTMRRALDPAGHPV